ncbi:SET domain-containing protein [Streptomyces sp. OfavH-34-F]|uniref:SET domain-containing protein n=1 Tax=unclassified Streptomyces TaxID=2593676 RepID=UPI001EF364D8|nr:SET domain-containing protein-lysine N-methyltransferase [Streptomyces sp. OfavH-34-F]MCG7523112.1 SET domain-containing protein [Streptomyces sp. OfavH-34-F]
MLTQGIDVRPSRTHNVGLFATEALPTGTVIWLPCTKCSRWSKEEVADLPPARFRTLDTYGHLLTDGSLLLPCLGAYLMNHSCEANVLDLGLDFGLAVRDIAPGEEITCDYATFVEDGGWSMECRCGSPRCRGRVTTEQGVDPGLRRIWRTRIDAALPRVAGVEQPLRDVLEELSEPYRRLLGGKTELQQVSTGASVCAPAFVTG